MPPGKQDRLALFPSKDIALLRDNGFTDEEMGDMLLATLSNAIAAVKLIARVKVGTANMDQKKKD